MARLMLLALFRALTAAGRINSKWILPSADLPFADLPQDLG